MTSEEQGKQNKPRSHRVRVGQVASCGGQKTASVVFNTLVKHGRYGKYVRRRTKLAVHDEKQQARVGDIVEIVPCRRMSRTKAHRLLRVVRSAE
ncbi:MAG: 30S ribosomal protein S17 [Phycisphaerae bacterium]|nr:30S ribosomal protein S17 [Phycisphaerae bacterium]